MERQRRKPAIRPITLSADEYEQKRTYRKSGETTVERASKNVEQQPHKHDRWQSPPPEEDWPRLIQRTSQHWRDSILAKISREKG